MNKIPENLLQQLVALSAMPDSDIDLSDIPETTPQQWLDASRGQFYRPIKKQLTVRIDSDVLEWLKSQGKGYQSRLNKILRTAMMENVRLSGLNRFSASIAPKNSWCIKCTLLIRFI